MANRLLTAYQMIQLCPWATIDTVSIPWRIGWGTYSNWMDILTADRLLPDDKFIEKYSVLLDHTTNVTPAIKNAYRVPRPEEIRGATHGDYTRMAVAAQNIKIAMRAGTQWDTLTPVKTEALHMIATKLARIVCGDSDCHDHWTDIAGYANLVEQRIPHKSKD